jgi:autoinducer 2-degrading protein
MASTNAHVVVVTFKIMPEFREKFMSAMVQNASDSLKLEDGCTVFDVCSEPQSQDIFLYEVYKDEDAFKAHLKASHFLAFDELTRPWVVDKRVSAFDRVFSA